MTLLSDYLGMCQVEVVGVVVELPNVNPTVVLRELGGQRREFWFPIGQADGVTLAMAWRRSATPRPLTHELMADIFARFGIALEVVKISGQAGKTYLAEMVLSRGADRQSVSCRPTDALTLALRRLVPVPIMVAEELMQPGSPGPAIEPLPESPGPPEPPAFPSPPPSNKDPWAMPEPAPSPGPEPVPSPAAGAPEPAPPHPE